MLLRWLEGGGGGLDGWEGLIVGNDFSHFYCVIICVLEKICCT